MAACDAPAVYQMGDDHFAGLATLDHFVVTVTDRHGIAARGLFLTDSHEAYLHLGAARIDPSPPVHATSLALADGVREAARRGCTVAVLGGGRNDRADTALLAFKRTLATRPLPRYTVKVGI